jgi:hypothetical protein
LLALPFDAKASPATPPASLDGFFTADAMNAFQTLFDDFGA